jgi:hypothetical protein
MEQNSGSQDRNPGFFQENLVPIIVVVLIAVLAIIYFVSRGNDNEGDRNDGQQTEQTGENSGNQQNQNQNGNETPTPNSGVAGEQTAGNVNVSGTLRASDNPAKGNLMLDSSQGKIYISTGRDFSSLLDKEVTLNAQGSLNSFRFLGFNGQNVTAPSTPSGQPAERNVTFNGTLQQVGSGHYTVTSGNAVVQLYSVHDYSAWVGSSVHLSATGSLDSFNNAVLSK